MAAPTKHYRLGPSSSSRWLACPGSALAEMPQVENVYGGRDEGSAAHHSASEVLLGNITLDDVVIEQQSDVTLYVEHVWANNCPTPPIVEKQFQSIFVDDHGGTIDCVLYDRSRKMAVVYDFKTGKWPVKAADNPQLLCYAGLLDETYEVENFVGVIVQPNSKAKDKITVARYPKEQVAHHRQKVEAAAVSDRREPGFSQCLFCPLLQAGMCDEGKAFAKKQGWFGKYKHLPG